MKLISYNIQYGFGGDGRYDLSRAARVVGVFPAASHPPIVYPLGRLEAATNPDGEGFRRFLLSREGRTIFVRFGFTAK